MDSTLIISKNKEFMIKTCGIELKGNDAIIICLEGNVDEYQLVLTKIKKINLKDTLSQEDIRAFSKQINEFLEDNDFDKVGIKARATKGRFAGGSVSFKMEALIQNSNAVVHLVSGATLRAKLKSRIESIDTSEINSYQEGALHVALYMMMR